MDLLPVEMKVEVFLRLRYGDRMTCRRVCIHWRNIIDDVVGLPVKITQTNMPWLFDSQMLVRAPFISIRPGPAVSQWESCPFSPVFLRSIYLRTKISSANWNMILAHCTALEELVFSLRSKKDYYSRNVYHRHEKDPVLEDLTPVTHPNLRRIMFRNILRTDTTKVRALLDTLTCPKLKQCHLSVGARMPIFYMGTSELRKTVISLVERNPTLHILSLAFNYMDMKHFVEYPKERYYKHLSVDDTLEVWRRVAAVYNYEFHSLSGFINNNTFQTLAYEILGSSSEKLDHLKLEIDDEMAVDCTHLNRFVKLTNLTLIGGHDSSLTNLNMLGEKISKLSFTVPISRDNLDHIFQLPELISVEFLQDFPSSRTLYCDHCASAKGHKSLQIIIMTQKNFKYWTKLEGRLDESSEKCWSEYKSNKGMEARRAVAFSSRMTDETWNWVWQNYSNNKF